mmetsp:Transcript_88333/g.175624  ORF Transcript_88333/g.175624 Transcript_88333/m.175624 type:complete len:494 (+) Transcript_88333:63-1544(+)
MGQPASRGMCCSLRDKGSRGGRFSMSAEIPQFIYSEVELPLEQPRLLAFAPLWQSGVVGARRMAIASSNMVHVYRLSDASNEEDAGSMTMHLESTLSMEEGQEVSALIFKDQDTSRHIVVAYGPAVGHTGPNMVRVWGCESKHAMPLGSPRSPTSWTVQEGYSASLEDHGAPVVRMAVSATFLLTGDGSGECRAWHKTRAFLPRAHAKLHNGGIIDLVMDRLFCYSIGEEDLFVRIWNVPELKQVSAIAMFLCENLMPSPGQLAPQSPRKRKDAADGMDPPPGTPAPTPRAEHLQVSEEEKTAMAQSPFRDLQYSVRRSQRGCLDRPLRLARLTAVRRPTSRWSAAQGTARGTNMPRGLLFVAGVVADGQDGIPDGSGVLMEWSLGAEPHCHCSQMAHDTPIVVLAHGPYDNGPVVTADEKGLFRVWDYTPRLWCSQEVQAGTAGNTGAARLPVLPAFAVDPLRRALYSTVGDRRLYVWRQHDHMEDGETTSP